MPPEIIDTHPHIISPDNDRYPPAPIRGQQSDWSKERPLTFEQLVQQMDDAGVAKAAIVQASTYYGYDNSYVADCVANAPQRFVGVYSVDVMAPDAVDAIKGWAKRGLGGLRLFTAGSVHAADVSWLDDPKTFPSWEFAADYGLSICIQTTAPGIPKVHALLERFPSTNVILDHLGRPKLDDGPPYKDAAPLFALSRFRNLYLKISPRTFALAKGGQSTPEAFFPQLVGSFGADRILFGSNLPANEGPLSNIVAEAQECLASLPEADRAMILSGTAKHLYPALA